MKMRHFHPRLLLIALATGTFGYIEASAAVDKVRTGTSEFVMNYGVSRSFELETRLKQLDVDRTARIASGINNRYQANFGLSWKPAQRFRLRPGIGYGWTERYGVRDTELSSKRLQLTIDAVFDF